MNTKRQLDEESDYLQKKKRVRFTEDNQVKLISNLFEEELNFKRTLRMAFINAYKEAFKDNYLFALEYIYMYFRDYPNVFNKFLINNDINVLCSYFLGIINNDHPMYSDKRLHTSYFLQTKHLYTYNGDFGSEITEDYEYNIELNYRSYLIDTLHNKYNLRATISEIRTVDVANFANNTDSYLQTIIDGVAFEIAKNQMTETLSHFNPGKVNEYLL
jgi:hypothetical protein